MEKILLLLVASIFVVGCNTNGQKLSSLQEYKLSSDIIEGPKLFGNIKSIKNNVYDVNDESGQILKGDMAFSTSSSDYTFSKNIFCVYDTNRNRVEISESNLSKDRWLISKYEYDYEGRQISMTRRNQDDDLTEDIIYKYDENGNMIELNSRKGYHRIYKYDENGNRIEENYFLRGLGLRETHKYKFDIKGNKIESDFFSDGRFISKYNYKYDKKGNKIEWASDKKVLGTYEYDSNGNIVKIKDSYDRIYTFKYEFDNNDNWIKRVEYENEIPKYIVEREIVYFPDSNDKESDSNYVPKGLSITSNAWEWENARFYEFSKFQITLSNKTNDNLKNIKYRIKLYKISKNNKDEVFSKSFQYNDIIFAGDVIRIPINELNRFNMGVDIRNENNWTWGGYIEDSEKQ